MPDFSIESQHSGIIAGIDEAGRGPLAGPVVASAVILNKENLPVGINDSKKTSIKKRNLLYQQIKDSSIFAVGIATVEEIDDINILNATMLAMKRAIDNLSVKPDLCLIDGNKTPENLNCKSLAIIKGDSLSLNIAAASIIAKVTRDKIMLNLSEEHPQYLWSKNSGYGTKQHLQAITDFGITKHHRKSFKPVSAMI